MYREDKATAMACFFLQKAKLNRLNDIKLMKLLYIADRLAMERYAVPISQDSYVSMQHGPVLTRTYRYLRDEETGSVWDEHISSLDKFNEGGDQSVSLLKMPVLESVLRESEIEILEEVWMKFGGKNQWQLKDHCHDNFPEYDERAERLHTSIRLDYSTIFEAFGDSEDIANAKVEELEFFSELERT